MTEVMYNNTQSTTQPNIEYDSSSSDEEYTTDADIYAWLDNKINKLYLQRQSIRPVNHHINIIDTLKHENNENDSKTMETDDNTITAQYMLDTVSPHIECAICRESITQCAVLLSCMHRYCNTCIARSLRNDVKFCPVCRIELRSKRDWRNDTRYDSIIQILNEHNSEYNNTYNDTVESTPVEIPAIMSTKYYTINIKSINAHNEQMSNRFHSLIRITMLRECNITVNQLCALIDRQLLNNTDTIVLYLEYNSVLLELCDWMNMNWLITDVLQWTEQTYIVKSRNSKYRPVVTLVYELKPA